jgi:hypothetical protein
MSAHKLGRVALKSIACLLQHHFYVVIFVQEVET